MPDKPRILFLAGDLDGEADLRARLEDRFEVVTLHNSFRALARLAREPFAGVYVASNHLADAFQMGRLVQSERILAGFPDGVALLDSNSTIAWANDRLRQWADQSEVVGENFYAILGSPEILGPDLCPFHTALATGLSSDSTLRCGENQYLHIHATPVTGDEGPPQQLIVTLRDVTGEILQQQKLAAIHQLTGFRAAVLFHADDLDGSIGEFHFPPRR